MSTVLALDFDGVICDSATETCVSAWKAGRDIWPEWSAPEPEAEVIRRFVAMRPALETGYQAIPMVRLAYENSPVADVHRDCVAMCDKVIHAHGLTQPDLIRRFGAARDTWIESDLNDWLSRHTFFPGTIDRLNALQSKNPTYIVTTKQERFALALLDAAGASIKPDQVFGFDRGLKKEEVLALIGTTHPGAVIHFVEDRLATLLRVKASSRRERIKLTYAAWGYGTEADLARAAADPDICVLRLDDICR